MKGIGVSPGIAIGRARVIKKEETELTGFLIEGGEEVLLLEIEKYEHAVRASINEIETIKANTGLTLSEEDIGILEAHIELLDDPQIKSDVVEKIKTDRKNANDAIIEVIAEVVRLFKSMDDEYMSARSADVQDIGNRLLSHLNNLSGAVQELGDDTIIIAEDLAPSDTITMDLNHIIGFATQMGGKTSHAAIIAKSKGIPAVVGCGSELNVIQNGDLIIINGSDGSILMNPGQELIDEYKAKREDYLQRSSLLKLLKDVPPVTTDGFEIKLTANISGAEDLDDMFDNGGDGVGLLRTELLFMGRDTFPDEEEQFEFYKKAALKSKGKSVIIRTLDIGGDKQLPYFDLPYEQNPFLGYRAIRICLDRKDIFLTQLRAILRASSLGNLKIMFPMICNIQELREAKLVLTEAKAGLAARNIPFNDQIETGIMIEIPSAAVMADILAKEADFFSIGTNDLCQYTLAVDRMNEKIEHLYDHFNPGVLRLINNIIEQGHKNNIHVGMCGEMASDPLATLLLAGMGLKEFSMSAASIPSVKNIIINSSLSKAKEVYKNVMEMDNSQTITAYLREVAQ